MTSETKELFSDLKFFNKLLSKLTIKPINEKTSVDSLIKLLKQSKKVNIKNFDEKQFLFEKKSAMNRENFYFHFNLKGEDKNHYNPVSICIEYKEDKKKYQVTAIEYAAHEKKLSIGYVFDYTTHTFLKEKYISFYNEKEDLSMCFNIQEKDYFGFYDSNNSSELYKKYLDNARNEKDAVAIMKRILQINPASPEQQELEVLNNDFTLENCIFSSKLNKAEKAFCMKIKKKLKNKSTNKK